MTKYNPAAHPDNNADWYKHAIYLKYILGEKWFLQKTTLKAWQTWRLEKKGRLPNDGN